MLISLWQPDNATLDSAPFTLKPGEAAILTATGFAKKRTKTTAEEFDSSQVACLHRLIALISPSGVVTDEPSSLCDALSANIYATTIVDTAVRVNGSTLGLSKCNNTLVFALPGTYYFHLNDTTAIGAAQVWLDIVQADKLPAELLKDFTGGCHA